MLLEKGADLHDATAEEGWTPLREAASYGGGRSIVEFLLKSQGAVMMINKEDHSDGRTPLMIAVRQGHEEVARYLMEQGADVSVCNQHGYNAALYACSAGGHISILRLLLDRSGDWRVVDGDGDGALHNAAECGHLLQVDMVKLLVEELGAETSRILNKADKTALYVARAHDQTHVVGYLGSKIN